MASHSQSTWVELRSLVRSSSSCRCGMCRLRKQRSWKTSACLPARVSQVMTVAEDPLGSRRV
jgi:hypothetical protein